MTKAGAEGINLSEAHRGPEEAVRARLVAQGLADRPRLLREIQQDGHARLCACSSSMAIGGVRAEDLLGGIEGRGLTAFLLDDLASADRILTF